MADVCRLSVQAWDQVSASTIARCWKKSKCLSVLYEVHLSNIHEKPPRVIDYGSTIDLFELFRKLEINNSVGDEQQQEACRDVRKLIEQWIDFEASPEGNLSLLLSLQDVEQNISEFGTVNEVSARRCIITYLCRAHFVFWVVLNPDTHLYV